MANEHAFQKKVRELLAPFQEREPTQELRKEIFEVLREARAQDQLDRPFDVELVTDDRGRHYIEISFEPFVEPLPSSIASLKIG